MCNATQSLPSVYVASHTYEIGRACLATLDLPAPPTVTSIPTLYKIGFMYSVAEESDTNKLLKSTGTHMTFSLCRSDMAERLRGSTPHSWFHSARET